MPLVNLKGSFIISCICKDGIVVGADSRFAFLDYQNKIVAHFENSVKVFVIQNLVITMAGRHFFESGISFNGLLYNFKRANTENLSVTNFLKVFFSYAGRKLPSSELIQLRHNHFLISGYENSAATIFVHHARPKITLTKDGYVSNHDKENKSAIINNFLKKADLKTASIFVEELIKRKITQSNKNSVSSIGGSPSIISIDNHNTIKWVKRQNKYAFRNIKQFAAAYKGNKIKIWHRSDADALQLKKTMSAYIE